MSLPLPERGLQQALCLASWGRLARDSSALRTFTIAEGVVMLVLGVLALIFPVLASGPPV